MDEHKHPSDSWDPHSYGNGSTQPPKSRGGIIAVLLVLVILLGGISSALGILNIRLFSMLEDQKKPEDGLHFEGSAGPGNSFLQQMEEPTLPAEILDALKTRLGVVGESVSGFYQHYYRLPAGLFIIQVFENSPQGVPEFQAGDILVQVGDIRVKSPQEAVTALESLPPGIPVNLVLFRAGRETTATYTPHSELSGE